MLRRNGDRVVKKVGVISGTFDPVHIGHIEAALVAKAALELDDVVFFVEKSPNHKTGVADYKHRRSMVEAATADFPSMKVAQSSAKNITLETTMKFLKKEYSKLSPMLIIGSDVLEHIDSWNDFKKLVQSMEIIIVLRDLKSEKNTHKKLEALQKKYEALQYHVLPPVWSEVSSSKIKADIKKNQTSELIHKNVLHYILANKLYR